MALADTKQSIGAVSELLKAQLTANTSVGTVDIGRPEQSTLSSVGPKYNLFLYQVDIEGHLRNYTLDQGQQAPMWLVLRYLLTAFDEGRESDTSAAHNLLGEGMLALQELNFLKPTAAALIDNPESLKLTFDVADSELLSKVMQGTDEKYRVSAAFQIRPILVAPSQPPSYTLPVLTVGPPANQGVAVFPTMGPRLESISPDRFTIGDTFELTGYDFAGVEEVMVGNVTMPVIGQQTGRLKVRVPEDTELSAGSHTIHAILALDSDHSLTSNAVLGHFLPKLDSVATGGIVSTAGMVSGTLTLNGQRLGGGDDSIFVAFYREGEVVLMLQATGTAAQTTMNVSVSTDDAIPENDYIILLRVNGEQAVDSYSVSWA